MNELINHCNELNVCVLMNEISTLVKDTLESSLVLFLPREDPVRKRLAWSQELDPQ